ncbi:PP2C family protein-serine/threonine phosphatase [Streptomyces sp. NPDC091279]|uniref:PP2C family protein-serine/threonine phosphatase n=1 Tax=unclassified Streptomyces TaxID=2593676 RepID=UPI00382D26BF
MTSHHIVARTARPDDLLPAPAPGPTRKGTALPHEPLERPDGVASPTPARRRSLFSPAADVIGSELDLHLTGSHVVHALSPSFCDAASVYLLERWLLDENAYAEADPPQVEARRLALRVGAQDLQDWERLLPLDRVESFPRESPHARALAERRTQRLDCLDPHTFARLSASGPQDPRIQELLRSASFLIVPLRLRDVAVGFVACTRGPERPVFGPGDAVAVERLAARACVALDNARRYERERRTARALRNSLPSGTDRTFKGCRFAHGYLPSGNGNLVGGDWFDALERPDGRVGLIVGDAVGHGPEAAVAMIQLSTAVRTLAQLDLAPVDLMRRLDALAATLPGAALATCMYAEWDPGRQVCTLVGAGHPPPLLRPLLGPTAPVVLTGAGLPLGLGTGGHEVTVVQVEEPLLLGLYTDGLVESRQRDIEQGITRLARALDTAVERIPRTTDDTWLPSLCRELLSSPHAPAAADDRTLLLVELTPG